MSHHREFVHLHGGLIFAIDALVADQAGRCDHVGGHAIANKQNDVLSLLLLGKRANDPLSSSI